MDYNLGIVYLGIACILIIICRIFFKPLKKILKILCKSAIGGGILYIINLFGITHIGVNLITMLTIGILGIPGAVLLFATQFI